MKPTNWLTPILFTHCMVVSSCGYAAEESIALLEYKVTVPQGSFYGNVNGEAAYKNWRRGMYDKEVLVEIKPQHLPSELPPPSVIHFLEADESGALKDRTQDVALTGEDKVFMRIAEDEQKARCVLLGQECEALFLPHEKDSVYYQPIQALQKKRKIIIPGTN